MEMVLYTPPNSYFRLNNTKIFSSSKNVFKFVIFIKLYFKPLY